jgi:hypothetical protein
MKSDEKRRVDSTEGVKMVGNAEAIEAGGRDERIEGQDEFESDQISK